VCDRTLKICFVNSIDFVNTPTLTLNEASPMHVLDRWTET